MGILPMTFSKTLVILAKNVHQQSLQSDELIR